MSSNTLNQLKSILNDPNVWKVLDKHLEECYNKKHIELENIIEPSSIYRTQGYIHALKDLRQLRTQANHA